MDDTQMIDLGGRTLMPGFVDTHSHMFTGYSGFGGSIQTVQEQVLAEGITTMADMGGARGEIIEELRAMDANGELRMRVSMYLNQITSCGEDFGYWYANYPQSIEPGALVHIPGVKIFLDGGSCNKLARSVGDPGELYFSLGEVIQFITDISARGYQVAVHALGDRAVEQVLQAMAAVIGDGPNDMRHRIEHNGSVRPDLIPLYSDSKPVATIFGGSVACWWAGASDRWGTAEGEYLDWEWPSRALIEANPDVVFAWHEDVPVLPLGAIEHLWGFVTRKQVAEDGSICEPPEFALAGAIPVETALKVMTINGAYALFRDNEIGSLEVGKLADMIILSDNPLTMPPDNLVNLDVLLTMVNGQAVYCAEGAEDLCP
jgi:predicted amidohydrolase YtcJ